MLMIIGKTTRKDFLDIVQETRSIYGRETHTKSDGKIEAWYWCFETETTNQSIQLIRNIKGPLSIILFKNERKESAPASDKLDKNVLYKKMDKKYATIPTSIVPSSLKTYARNIHSNDPVKVALKEAVELFKEEKYRDALELIKPLFYEKPLYFQEIIEKGQQRDYSNLFLCFTLGAIGLGQDRIYVAAGLTQYPSGFIDRAKELDPSNPSIPYVEALYKKAFPSDWD